MMSTMEQFDTQMLVELAGRTDPNGVLSLYVDLAPGRRDAAAIDINNRFRELQRRVGDNGGPARREVLGALERLRREVDQLSAPTGRARGRMTFAGLSDDWVVRLDSQLPVPNRVVLDDGPFIHPLLELLDEGRPAGVVLISGGQGRVLEWRLGELQPVADVEQDETEAPHERAGQIGGGPAGQFNTPMLEHRHAREQHLAQRFAGTVADMVAQSARERGWERILVSPAERWNGSLTAGLPEAVRDAVILEPRVLAGLDRGALASAVTDRLHDEHRAHEQRLADRLHAAGRNRTAALGLSEVTAALNQGRVAHLLYDPEVRYAGSVQEDGSMSAGEESGAGAVPGTPEPRLTERLVDRALATGARISPVEGAARGTLAAAAGIAALLRW